MPVLDPSGERLAGARFAIAAPDGLAEAARALDPGATLAELRVAASQVAHQYVDAVLDGFVLALARAARGAPNAGARTANLVRSFADRFITPGVRSSKQDQLDDFLDFLRHHLIVTPERSPRTAIAFVIDEDFASALAPALAAAAAGQPADRQALHGALHATVDSCLHHFLDVPLALIHLGFLARAAIAVGRSGVATRAHGAIDEVLRGTDDAAVTRLAAFVAGAVVPNL
ncbi:MAG: hypothetical protein K8W52_00830 [Deltaproteobacteria bacterium]|nr:hypothetical protein [Deltaproteobacteria bacterium]